MRIEDAIKELNDCLKSNKNCLWCPNDKTLTLVIEELEKQIPKEPIKVSKGGEEYSGCPRCGKFVFGDYCSECGQALKLGGAG